MSENTTFQDVFNQAIKYLSFRTHSLGELQDKLLRKKFPRPLINQALRRLEELDYLNDERYARLYLESLKLYKILGYFGIKAKLLKKKIPSEIIERVLEEGLDAEEEAACARRFLDRKKISPRSYEQLARGLAGRGFHTDVIRRALNEFFAANKADKE
ncbi:MAG: regulatory protein RecX [Candidatus Doudnabacteria bacterium]|nr:regulatory protein RecX [Candidatus Doudnabacteria bacterium]